MKKRGIVSIVLLSIITCGIYYIYCYCSFQGQLKKLTGEGYGAAGHFFATLFTCGIYAIVWAYRAGGRLEKVGCKNNETLYLILSLCGMGGIAFLLMQSEVNGLSEAQ